MKLLGAKKPEPVKEEKPVKKSAPKSEATQTPANDRISRSEFVALQERVATLERLLGNTSYIEVPGLTVIDDDDHPDQHNVEIDKTKCAAWTEPQMIAAGAAFGLDLSVYRGQPREIRRLLYEEMALHGIVLDRE